MRKSLLIGLAVVILMGCAKQDSSSVAQKELSKFYKYSTVDWARIDTPSPMPA